MTIAKLAGCSRYARSLSTHTSASHLSFSSKTIIYLTGATGAIGFSIQALLASKMARPGVAIIGLARDPSKFVTAFPERTTTQKADFSNSDKLATHLLSRLKPTESIVLVNTIGGAHPIEGHTYEGFVKLNHDPAIVCAEALKAIKAELKVPCTFVHMSSIMAHFEGKNNLYGRVKRLTELELMKDVYREINPICLRLGYVLNQPSREPKHHHLYDAEDLASLPVQFLVQDGSQRLQPVSIHDITRFILNADRYPFTEAERIVNAVGPESITQLEFVKFYSTMLGRPFAPVFIEQEDFEFLAKTNPRGHLALYAHTYFSTSQDAHLSPDTFLRVVDQGRLETMSEYYRILTSDETFSSPTHKTTITNHIAETIFKALRNEETPTLLKLARTYIPRIASAYAASRLAQLKAFFK